MKQRYQCLWIKFWLDTDTYCVAAFRTQSRAIQFASEAKQLTSLKCLLLGPSQKKVLTSTIEACDRQVLAEL